VKTIRRFFMIGLDAFYTFLADDGWAIASHIALSTLMALFPFLIVLTSLAGFFGSKELADQAAELLLQVWPTQVASALSGEIHDVLTTTRGDALTVGAVLAVYFASNGIESLRVALNRAYAVTEPRRWYWLRLESIGYTLIAAVTALILAFLIVLGPLILEAALAWRAADTDARWAALATDIVQLAETRLLNSPGGVIGEHFDGAWEPLRMQGWIVEPGHQFEWASLFLGFAPDRPELKTAALRLIEFSEDWGVDAQREVAINSCFVHGRRRDAEARLWPQTERIKASCMAAEATGDFIHVSHAIEATHTLMQYFETPVRGLWRDRMSAEGLFVEEPVPASSLYHIVGAALALDRLVRLTDLQETLKSC
jgi:hypothetical protein